MALGQISEAQHQPCSDREGADVNEAHLAWGLRGEEEEVVEQHRVAGLDSAERQREDLVLAARVDEAQHVGTEQLGLEQPGVATGCRVHEHVAQSDDLALLTLDGLDHDDRVEQRVEGGAEELVVGLGGSGQLLELPASLEALGHVQPGIREAVAELGCPKVVAPLATEELLLVGEVLEDQGLA